MAWTNPRTWSPGETVTAALMNQYIRDQQNVLATFSKTLNLYDSNNALGNPANLVAWRPPFNAKVVACYGLRVGGTGTFTVNARKLGTTKFCSPDITVSSASTWIAGVLSTTTANLEVSTGDLIEAMLILVGNSDSGQLAVQIDFNPR